MLLAILPKELEIKVWKQVWKDNIYAVHTELLYIKLNIINGYLLEMKKPGDWDHKSRCIRIVNFLDDVKYDCLIPELQLIKSLYWTDVLAYTSMHEEMWDWVDHVNITFERIKSKKMFIDLPDINDFWTYSNDPRMYPRIWEGDRQEYTCGLH